MIDSRLKMELGNVRKGFEDFTATVYGLCESTAP